MSEFVTYQFFKSWVLWEEAHDIRDWMQRGFKFHNADVCLYEAISCAGLQLPDGYRLPRIR